MNTTFEPEGTKANHWLITIGKMQKTGKFYYICGCGNKEYGPGEDQFTTTKIGSFATYQEAKAAWATHYGE